MNQDQIFAQAMKSTGIRSVEINGKTYSIKLLPAFQGLKVGTQLVKLAAPVLGVFADNSNKEEFVLPEEQNLFTEASMLLVSQMDKVDIIEIIQKLLANLTVDGQQVNIDQHFMGNYGDLLAVVELSLKENFGDFFTTYLKAKGLEIPTLGAMMGSKQEETASQ